MVCKWFCEKVTRMMGAHRVVVPGNFNFAGVVNARVPNSVAVRIFYPAASSGTEDAALWFPHGFYFAATAQLHTHNIRVGTWKYRILSILIRILSIFLPGPYLRVPQCFNNAPVAKSPAKNSPKLGPSSQIQKFPLVMFSHGLTGFGEEHALFFANLARQGFVVACVTHQDGSASKAILPNGQILHYQHPDLTNYPRDFRIKQVLQREKEFMSALDWVLNGTGGLPDGLRQAIDSSIVIGSGFSFGAATASQAACNNPDKICACLLLDGWFRVDLAALPGGKPNDFLPMPPAAHSQGFPHKTLLLTSQAFRDSPVMLAGIQSLLEHFPRAKETTMQDTVHMSFIELFVWVPAWVLRRVLGAKRAGSCVEKYNLIQGEAVRFVQEVVNAERQK